MKEIRIRFIPATEHRYDTCGDWYYEGGDRNLLTVAVSRLSDERSEFAIAIHEAVEAYLCRLRGIAQRTVDRFDIQYEEARERGGAAPCGCTPTETSEPGEDRHAPYYREHRFATRLERMLVREMGMGWRAHNG